MNRRTQWWLSVFWIVASCAPIPNSPQRFKVHRPELQPRSAGTPESPLPNLPTDRIPQPNSPAVKETTWGQLVSVRVLPHAVENQLESPSQTESNHQSAVEKEDAPQNKTSPQNPVESLTTATYWDVEGLVLFEGRPQTIKLTKVPSLVTCDNIPLMGEDKDSQKAEAIYRISEVQSTHHNLSMAIAAIRCQKEDKATIAIALLQWDRSKSQSQLVWLQLENDGQWKVMGKQTVNQIVDVRNWVKSLVEKSTQKDQTDSKDQTESEKP